MDQPRPMRVDRTPSRNQSLLRRPTGLQRISQRLSESGRLRIVINPVHSNIQLAVRLNIQKLIVASFQRLFRLLPVLKAQEQAAKLANRRYSIPTLQKVENTMILEQNVRSLGESRIILLFLIWVIPRLIPNNRLFTPRSLGVEANDPVCNS